MQDLELRIIQRQRVQQTIAIAAIAALLLTSCGSSPSPSANEKVDAVFYENTPQCEADVKKQQAEYQVLLAAQKKGDLKQSPTPPTMKAEDCAPQMLAAQQEHERTAPVYGTEQDCRAEGVQCESVTTGSSSGYRPVYGGTYFYPYHSPSYVYVNYGGSQHRVYETRPVYASSTPGEVVTPHGQTVSKTTPGRVTAPRHTTVLAPPRPTGTAARGTISGRSSQGFGSTYKSTGSGGK